MKLVKTSILAAVVMLSSLAFARTEPNSFLNTNVSNHAQLMAQVQKDPVVMQRFMRHFGMTRQQVIEYFQTLKMDTLSEDGVYLVYNVPESEEIRARAIFYKKGTKVWVDQEGTLVLKASCGNPMLRGTDSRPVALSTPLDAKASPVRPMAAAPGIGTPSEFTAAVVPVEVETSALTFPAESPGQIAAIAGSGFNPAFLVPLAAIPFIIDTPKDPIPEPATMTALIGAAGAIVARRKLKKMSA